MHIKLTLSTLAFAALLATPGARAAAIASPTSTITGSVITFNEFDGLITTGPQLVAPDVTFSSVPNSVIGANNQDLGNNGLWGARGDIERTPGDGNTLVSTPTVDGNFIASDFVARRGEFGFDFGLNPVQSVGAFVNQYQGTAPNSMVVLAYGVDGEVLESFSIAVDTGAGSYNEGLFVGITRNVADIGALSFKGGGVVLDDFSHSAPIPEPGTTAMLLAGLGAVGLLMRRRKPRR
jgi:hypothetical protein